MHKGSKYSASIKEKSPSVIGESLHNGLNGFIAEFSKYATENEVEHLPEFIVKTVSGTLIPKSSSKIAEEDSSVKEIERYAPVFHLILENGRKWDSLKGIQSKDKEITIPVLDSLNFTMEKYNTVTVLKLQDCHISAFGIIIIAKILVEIGCVSDLNLDMNPNTMQNYHLLCSAAANLSYLSLQFCEISDDGAEKIANELEYKDPQNISKLVVLNLANNRITEIGAGNIARMLRTNRSLQSLNLCGNRICDGGASLIVQELSMSALTHYEIVAKRRRRFAELILLEENNHTKPNDAILFDNDRAKINKPRKKSSLSQKSKKSLPRIPSGSIKTDHTPFSARSSKEKVGSILPDIDKHPFKYETAPFDGSILTCGNFEIQHLNLQFCGLTVSGLNSLIKCLHYQNYMLGNDTSRGLLHVLMEGNRIPEESEAWQKFRELLRLRCGRETSSTIEHADTFVPKEASVLRDAIMNRGSLVSQ